MNWWRKIVPDEWISAVRAARNLAAVAQQTERPYVKRAFGFGIPFLIGALLGLFAPNFITKDISEGILTIAGVLAGFVVTQMLFTGRVAGTEMLSLENARDYMAKVTYLLWSQTLTFLTYLATVVVALMRMAYTDDLPGVVMLVLPAGLMGLSAVSLLRTLLLPYQIYEVHRFSLEALVQEKENKAREQKEEQVKRIRSGTA